MIHLGEGNSYNIVKNFYEQAKSICKGVIFEILLEPIDPESGDIAESHIIDYSDCVEDFELNDTNPGREFTLHELLTEIGKLREYKKILQAANDSIENIKQQYKDKFTVKLVRVMDYKNREIDTSLSKQIFESESENEFQEDSDLDDEWEEEWEGEWTSDSGVDSPLELEEDCNLVSSNKSEVYKEPDSGLQTESDEERVMVINWESGSELENPSTSELNEIDYQYESQSNGKEFKPHQNSQWANFLDSDNESIIAEPSQSADYEED